MAGGKQSKDQTADHSNELANRKAPAKADPAHSDLLTEETNAVSGVVSIPASGLGIATNGPTPINALASGIDMMDIKTVEKEIGKACKEGAKQSAIAVKASLVVATYAWVTGKLILRAKSLLKTKGEFGDWCQKNLVKPGLMSVKTAQRYMAVAKKWDSLDALVAGVPNLWTAYQQAGVLPIPADADDAESQEITGAQDDATSVPPVSNVAEYVAEFSKLQKMLRRLGEMRPQDLCPQRNRRVDPPSAWV